MFDLSKIYYFGDGSLGDVEFSDGASENINSYAKVTSIAAYQISVDTANWKIGDFEDFSAGNTILIHASTGTKTDKLGKFLVAKITLRQNDVLLLDKDFSQILSDADLADYHVQAITFANFDCLKLSNGSVIMPPTYDPFNFYGGILAVKCKNQLIFDGGNISLSDCGITPFNKNLRPLTDQELDDKRWGEENFELQDKFLLNVGDGAAFICAKFISANENSRIGNLNSHGKPLCSGAFDPFKPSDITNIGGSSILIACENNLPPTLISKYRTKTDSLSDGGAGLARAYVASLKPVQDGLLFAADFIAAENRLSNQFNLFSFGNGENGNLSNPTFQLNNFANIFTSHATTYFWDSATRRGLANFCQNSFVLLLKNNNFAFAKIISNDEESLQIDFDFDADKIVAVPQLKNLTLNQSYSTDIFAVAVKDNCDLANAVINAQKIFIVADNLILNEKTKFNAPTFICANSISGLDKNSFSSDRNLIFVNQNLSTDKKMLVDHFQFLRQGLFKCLSPIDATNVSNIFGFDIQGTQPQGSERKFVFTVEDKNFIFSGNDLIDFTYPITLDNVLNFGNSAADLLAVTNIPAWCGKKIFPAIALSSTADSPVMPTCNLALICNSANDIYVKDFYSAEIPICGRFKSFSKNIALTGNASADSKIRLKKDGVWGNWIDLDDAIGSTADSFQLKIKAALSSLNSDSVKINSVNVQFTDKNVLAVGQFAIFSNEFAAEDNLQTAYVLVRHSFLNDKNLKVFVSFSNKEEKNIFLGNGSGNLQNFTIPDPDADFNSLVVRADDKNIPDFAYDSASQTLSVTATSGADIFANYFVSTKENWLEMERQFTVFDQNFDQNVWTSRFVYRVESGDFKAVKVKILADCGIDISTFAAGFSYD